MARTRIIPATSLAALLAAITAPGLATAETIEVPVGQQAKQKWTIDRPITGMKQSQVEALFGKPVDWRKAVGDPPISSWIYQDFVVYFEYDHVIHTVLTHSNLPVATTDDVSDQQ
jgi:hypothetical protein